MPQDIQTFSDALAINTRGQLNLELRIQFHGRTEQEIHLNSVPIVAPFTLAQFDLLEPIELKVELTDFDEGTSAVEIEYFGINGLEVLPRYHHLASSGGSYIDKLGTWRFQIAPRFYPWYHAISGQGWIA